MSREDLPGYGYARSDLENFVIGTGANGSAVEELNFERGYMFYVIRCANCTGIAANTTLSLEVADDTDDDTMFDLSEVNDPGSIWQSATNLPTSGSFRCVITQAAFAQKLRLILSNNVTEDVTFTVYGYDSSKA